MAITFIGQTAGHINSGSSIVAGVPAGVLENDLLIWVGYINNLATPAVPTSFTNLYSMTGTAQAMRVSYRVASASEPASYTWSGLTGSRYAWAMLCFRGAHLVTQPDVAGGNTNGTTLIAFPATTPATAGAVILAIAGSINPANVWTTTFATTNLDAILVNGATDGAHATSVASANPAIGIGTKAWTAGAFTPAMTKTNTSTRTTGVSLPLRAATDLAGPVVLTGDGTLTLTGVPAVAGPVALTGEGTLGLSGVLTGGQAESGTLNLTGDGSLLELFPDPGFETGLNGWANFGSTVTRSTVNPHTGTWSLRAIANAGAAGGMQRTFVAPGDTTYRYTAWAWIAQDNNHRIRVAGVGLAAPVLGPSNNPHNVWVPLSLDFTTLPGGGTVTTYYYGVVPLPPGAVGGETAYLDDVSLTILPTIGVAGSTGLAGGGTLTLAGVATHTATGAVTLAGDGTLAAGGNPSTAGAVGLSGAGTLTLAGEATTAATGTVNLTGTGTLTGAGAPATTETRPLSGAGTLTGTGTPTTAGTAPLTGTGDLGLTGAAEVIAANELALDGEGTQTRAGHPATTASRPLSGVGTLALAGVPRRTGTATLTGTGTLTLTGGTPATRGTATRTGTGTLTTTGVAATAGAGTATLTGTGTLTTTGGVTAVTGTVNLTGDGALTNTGIVPQASAGDLELSGTGTLTAALSGDRNITVRAALETRWAADTRTRWGAGLTLPTRTATATPATRVATLTRRWAATTDEDA